MSYRMHTDIALDRTKREIVHCLSSWPGALFVSIGDYRDQNDQNAAIVVFDYNGQRVRVEYAALCCHRCNMRAVFITLDDLRKTYKRGLGDVLTHTVAQMLALPGSQYIDPYELLGVRPDADTEIVDAAAKALLRRWHPDKHPDWTEEERADGTRRCQQFNEAVERIKRDREGA